MQKATSNKLAPHFLIMVIGMAFVFAFPRTAANL
jgi:Na+-transporting methylmalonyl-CoA/oxaloacetate decarboxylase gamma subunit